MYMFIQGRLQQSAGVPRRRSGRETLDSCTWLFALPPPPTETEAPCPGELNHPSCSLLPRDVEYGQSERRSPALGKSRDSKRPPFLSIGNGNPSGPGQRDAALYRWSWEPSAHHVVAVDSVGGILHGVVHLSPERRQVLGKPEGEAAGQRVRARGRPLLRGFLLPGRLPRGGLDTPSYIFCIKLRAEHSPVGLVRTDLSLFLVRRLRSMPSMRFSKQRCIACCFSGGWLFTMLFLKSEKYCRRHEKAGLTSRRTASLALGHSRKEGGNVLQLFGWLLVPLKTQT